MRKATWTKILFVLFVFSMSLGTRILLGSFIPGFHEYEAAFLYANDLMLAVVFIGFIGLIGRIRPIRPILPFVKKSPAPPLQKGEWESPRGGGIFLALFLAFAFLSIFWAPSSGLAFYQFIRLLLLAGLALATAALIANNKLRITNILAVIAAVAIAQSLLAIAQFGTQSDLGLQLLGEPSFGARLIRNEGGLVLRSFSEGGAKIFVEGAKVFRPAGTFPHANVLGAYLIVGLLALYYFWLRRPSEWKIFSSWKTARSDLFWALGIFIVLLGIFISFSRATWLVAALATFGTLAWIILRGFRQKNEVFRQAVRLSVLLVALTILLFTGFSRLVLPRAAQVVGGTDPSVSGRVAYQNLGLSLIAERPFGVGLGNQVLYAVESGAYQKRGMTKVWQWEPIHNLYLLIAAEIGVLGAITFLVFIAALLIPNIQFLISNKFRNWELEIGILTIMLPALLLLGLFDHFLWTLQPGRLLLWLTIGIVMGISRPHGSTDRTQASEA